MAERDRGVDSAHRREPWKTLYASSLPLLPILAWLAAAWPLLRHGFAEGHDWLFELVRIAQFRDALTDAPFPPAWAGDLYGGYGSPIFLFYSPLFLLGASSLAAVSGSAVWGASGAVLGVLAMGGWSMSQTTRIVLAHHQPALRNRAAHAASCIFLLSPYLLANAYLRNANAELTALAFSPWVLAGLTLCRRGTRRGPLWLGLALAAVILAHNLTALWVFASALVLVGILPSEPGAERRRAIASSLGGLTLGLGLSAFFWVPALGLKSWMRTQDLLAGTLDFHQQFPSLTEIFWPGSFFAVGPLFPILWLVSLWLLGKSPSTRPPPSGPPSAKISQPSNLSATDRLIMVLVGALLGCLFLTQPISVSVWERLPFLPLYQFPWRWLGPLAVATALLAAMAFARGFAAARRWRGELSGVLFLLCLVNAAPTLLAVQPLAPERRTSLGTTALEPAAIRHMGARATVLDEYLPSGADPELWRRHPAWQGALLSAPPEPIVVSVQADTGHRVALEVETPTPAPISLRRWYFPGWAATADGAATRVGRGPGGSLVILAPAGKHHLEVRFEPPPIRRLAVAVSLVSTGLWLFLWFAFRAPRRALLPGSYNARDLGDAGASGNTSSAVAGPDRHHQDHGANDPHLDHEREDET